MFKVKILSRDVMKKLIILIFPLFLFSQNNYVFGPSIRVNDDPPGSSWHSVRSSGQHGIVCRGDTVYIVFDDERNSSNRYVYFSKSTDAGTTWSPNIRIDGDLPGIETGGASITLDAKGWLYVTWMSWEAGNDRNVYFAKSTDGGENFSYPVIVNDTTRTTQEMPSIAVDSSGQKIFIAWDDTRNPVGFPNYDIYFSRSTDGGLNFEPSIRVDDTGNDSSWQQIPSIGCTRSGDTIYVAWRDDRNCNGTDNIDVYFSRSVDGGVSFEPNILVNDTVGTTWKRQWDPSLWVDNSGTIYIVWDDGFYPSFAKSIDGGQSFIGEQSVSDTATGGKYPSICSINDSFIYVAWQDQRTYSQTGDDIYFSFSSDGGSTFNPNVRVNDLEVTEDAWDWDANITVNNDGKVFVAWDSDRNDIWNWDIYFATGQYVGIMEEVRSQRLEARLQCYPNPFSKLINISFSVGRSAKSVGLRIYDVSGRLVRQYDYTTMGLSNYIIWYGDDEQGHQVPCGIYFVRIKTSNKSVIKKVVKIE